jgi:hypothetical protein
MLKCVLDQKIPYTVRPPRGVEGQTMIDSKISHLENQMKDRTTKSTRIHPKRMCASVAVYRK